MFEFMRSFIANEDGKILFILSMLVVAMMIDMLTGTIGAKVNKDIQFVSGKGINGILRKMCTLIVALFFLPMSVLIPNNLGVPTLYTLFMGLLFFEVLSIFENLKKMGINVELFERILEVIKKK